MNERPTTRSALLEAARDLFARDGYDGTSIRAITARAGANLGAVTYHFETKEKLYDAVLESFTLPLRARLDAELAAPRPPLDALEAAVRTLFAFLTAFPAWPSLMLHELALGRPLPAPVSALLRSTMVQVTGRIRAGQRDGSIVPGNPQLLTFSILAQPIYMALVGRRLREVFGIDARQTATQRRFADHAVRFMRRGLAAKGRNG